MNILCILCKVHFAILTGYIATLIHFALLMVDFALLRVQFVFSGLILFAVCLKDGTRLSQLELSVGISQLNSSFPGCLSGRVGQLWTDVTARKWWLRMPAKREPYCFTVRFTEGSGAALRTARYTIISIQTDNTSICFSICPSSVHRVGAVGAQREFKLRIRPILYIMGGD